MTTTTAAVVESPGSGFALQEIGLEEPRDDEVLVRMTAAGLCHTDLGVAHGALPFPLPGVLGHEGAGIVEQVGAGVTSVVPGDQVLLSFTSCAHCDACRSGHPAYCDSWLTANLIGGQRADGSSPITREGKAIGGHFFGQSSFARHAIVDERSIVKVDADAAARPAGSARLRRHDGRRRDLERPDAAPRLVDPHHRRRRGRPLGAHGCRPHSGDDDHRRRPRSGPARRSRPSSARRPSSTRRRSTSTKPSPS